MEAQFGTLIRAAMFVTRNCVYETGSMTGILGQLKLGIPKRK